MTGISPRAVLGAMPHGRRTSPERLDAWRDARLRRLVRHAATVPFWRDRFATAGVRPDEIGSAADLSRLPITSKADLDAVPTEQLLAPGLSPERLRRASSSGVTGEPFVMHRTWAEQTLQHWFLLRALARYGCRPTDRTAVVHYLGPRARPGARRTRRMLGALGLGAATHLDVRRNPAELVAELVRCRPQVLLGYPSILLRIAEVAHRAGIAIRPRVVVTGSEVLRPAVRERLAAVFSAPVYTVYGATECQLVAAQCPSQPALHLCDDNVVVELIRPDGAPARSGELGEVVITSLHGYAQPLIRYRLGDLAVAGERCRCGAPWRTIAAVQGRTVDYLRLPDGRRIHPYDLTDRVVWDSVPWVRRFQLVQERTDRIRLRVVPAFRPDDGALASMTRSVRSELGSEVEFALELVDDIPQEPSGKFRLMRSLVPAGEECG